ncbi:hypothetical protein CANARDRAFT_21169 [[Candida] arabinofermentans NRRL YB-2248]|uniref:Mitochondrial import protein 1 n=1 Tax=[Candida] arabinofermentans NRRL YB-2248 TaxID=983967 RepID=A0A1E4T649_9ASCO|nr:hypothetical protein CANARDRAFT_21169 [[Candida] arabinofermentans NRRL YB-2248]
MDAERENLKDLLHVTQDLAAAHHHQQKEGGDIITSTEKQDLANFQQEAKEQVEGITADSVPAVEGSDFLEDSESALASQYESNEEYDITPGGVWSFVASCGVNLILPFINGVMLGFGEILAHEIGFKYNWAGARVLPARRLAPAPAIQSDIKARKSVLFG